MNYNFVLVWACVPLAQNILDDIKREYYIISRLVTLPLPCLTLNIFVVLDSAFVCVLVSTQFVLSDLELWGALETFWVCVLLGSRKSSLAAAQ